MMEKNRQKRSFSLRIKTWLDELDARNEASLFWLWGPLDRLDNWSEQRRRQRRERVTRFLQGASRGATKKRTGNPVLDALNRWWFNIGRLLDHLDTVTFFPGRPYQTRTGRVRSKAEKKIANWLYDRKVKYEYEKPLILGVDGFWRKIFLSASVSILPQFLARKLVKKNGGVLLYPDFYLVRQSMYLEYWGLADAEKDFPEYNEVHRRKLGLYRKHGIKVISVYPRHLRRNLDDVLPELFRKATGCELS